MKMKLLSALTALSMLVGYTVSATGNDKVEISFKVGDNILSVNGAPLEVTTPYIVGEGTTLVPVRVIAEAFSADVIWDSNDYSVNLEYLDTNITIKIGSNLAIINDRTEKLDEAPQLHMDTTMVPLRFISETFGATVTYDNETRFITVSKETDDSLFALSGKIYEYRASKALLDSSTGEIISGGRSISDFIKVDNGLELLNVLQVSNPDYATVCFYDGNKNFVKSYRSADRGQKVLSSLIIRPDTSYKYIRYTSNSNYATYRKRLLKSEMLYQSKNFGKKVAVFGGSFASLNYATNSFNYWSEKLGWITDVYSVGGAGFAKKSETDTKTIQSQVDKACADDADLYDIYILWASTNDLGIGVNNIGDVTSYTDKDNYDKSALFTQCGGINYCIQKIYEKNPNAKICFLTSIRGMSYGPRGYDINYSGSNLGLNALVEKQIACCEVYGIPYLDQFKNVELNKSNYTQYTTSDGHLNPNGYDLIKDLQVSFFADF